MKVILTIAGSDSGGGAGIQADIKAIQANGGYAATVVTAVTAQNARTVTAIEAMPPAVVSAQLDAVFSDIPVAACKSGMLANAGIIAAVAAALRRYAPPAYVLDPVLISTSGAVLLEESAIEALKSDLFPLATLVTPNVPEAEKLTGMTIHSARDAEDAGKRLLDLGPEAVLVKGGHLEEDRATDVLVTWSKALTFPGDFIEGLHTHGTGCAYSAAIATHLGRGKRLTNAVRLAKDYVTEAIRHAQTVGSKDIPDHLFYLRGADGVAWQGRLSLHDSKDERP